ncbi:hypothetical protein J3Q64DRAFT_1495290 [Phycomyces blakesleeanus]|uniref:Vacuolar membrane protein n=1 Tax=Phycomyces blakesleeanus TaxID=4837 RepID=A0ABR3B0N9_PHYBL
MCGNSRNGPKWKREVVQDHKFEYVDLDEFYDSSCTTRIGYSFIYLVVLKSLLVYIADLWTAVSLLVIDHRNAEDSAIPYSISKWIFLGAIFISFALLFWDFRKSRRIIATRNISYTFTSVMASRYYSMKDYRYYCLFCEINKSQKTTDTIAFFVFFTLKGWKKLLLAEAPRQVINVVTLIKILPAWIKLDHNQLQLNNEVLGKDIVQQLMTCTMLFSTAVFAVSFVLVCIAALMYIPLLCHMQGNLKEYCCHKVDKRISELLKNQARRRIAAHQKTGGKSSNKKHKNDKNNDRIEMNTFPQPTLPNLNMDGMDYRQSPRTQPRERALGGDDSMKYLVSPFGRRNSDCSTSSDRVGLTSNAQPQPWAGQNNIVYHHQHGSSPNIYQDTGSVGYPQSDYGQPLPSPHIHTPSPRSQAYQDQQYFPQQNMYYQDYNQPSLNIRNNY